jgi:hypothetical protein
MALLEYYDGTNWKGAAVAVTSKNSSKTTSSIFVDDLQNILSRVEALELKMKTLELKN